MPCKSEGKEGKSGEEPDDKGHGGPRSWRQSQISLLAGDWLLDTIGIEASGGRPVRKDALDLNVLVEDVQHLEHVAFVVGNGIHSAIVPATST